MDAAPEDQQQDLFSSARTMLAVRLARRQYSTGDTVRAAVCLNVADDAKGGLDLKGGIQVVVSLSWAANSLPHMGSACRHAVLPLRRWRAADRHPALARPHPPPLPQLHGYEAARWKTDRAGRDVAPRVHTFLFGRLVLPRSEAQFKRGQFQWNVTFTLPSPAPSSFAEDLWPAAPYRQVWPAWCGWQCCCAQLHSLPAPHRRLPALPPPLPPAAAGRWRMCCMLRACPALSTPPCAPGRPSQWRPRRG